ncbi:MAG: plasmid pRiA4b ORF-3 family protein [Mediterranea sp.]|jgi:hypothetical protein|nr:plasmid pRiA4b ORF-3 family protein [Mediterranea sp.]
MQYQFRITLNGITRPTVWRRVAVPSTFTFYEFHRVIQQSFGWRDGHLFEFRERERGSSFRITIPDRSADLWFTMKTVDARKSRLSKIFDTLGKLVYIYDFGDNWTHEIVLESTLPEEGTKATCLEGEGACPPEDCGGFPGYEQLKAAFEEDPKGEEANDYREWLGLAEGENWDPYRFDRERVNELLGR